MGVSRVFDEDDEAEPMLFTFHEDKSPYKELSREEQPPIEKFFEDAFYEQAIVVKQLMKKPAEDTFSVVLFSRNPNQQETSCILIFKRIDNKWQMPKEYVQK